LSAPKAKGTFVDSAVNFGKDAFDSVKNAIGLDVKDTEPKPFFTKPLILTEQQAQTHQKNINFLNAKQIQTEKNLSDRDKNIQKENRKIFSNPIVAPLALMAGSTASMLGGITFNKGMKDAGDWLQDVAFTENEKKTDIATDFKNNPAQAVTKIVKATYQQTPQMALRFIGSGAGLTPKATELLVVGTKDCFLSLFYKNHLLRFFYLRQKH